MATPGTYLLSAPSDAIDALGTTMTSADLVKGLRQCNANLNIPDPSVFGWYPGKAAGQTTLWLGEPFKGKKIAAFRLGAIPEWTQIDPRGLVIARGWRSVLSKVIRSQAATKAAIERVFKINMDVTGVDAACPQCKREGLGNVRATSASGLCDTHDSSLKQIYNAKRQRKDAPAALRDLAHHEARLPVSFNLRSGGK